MKGEHSKFFTILSIILAVIVIWFASVIVHLERYRYASQVGICNKPEVNYVTDFKASVEREECLQKATPRTSWAYDLFYALTD